MNILIVSASSLTDIFSPEDKTLKAICMGLDLVSKENNQQNEVTVAYFNKNIIEDFFTPEISFINLFEKGNKNKINFNKLISLIKKATIIHIFDCLSPYGMMVAAHCRLLNKIVIGSDVGKKSYGLLPYLPRITEIYNCFHIFNQFNLNLFYNYISAAKKINLPIDTHSYLSHSLSKNKNKLFAFGRMHPEEGFETIIRALPKNLLLTILTYGQHAEYKNYLLSLVENKKIQILDNIDQESLNFYLKTANLYINSTTHIDYQNNFWPNAALIPLTPLECLSSGVIVFSTKTGGLSELNHLPGFFAYEDEQSLSDLFNRYEHNLLDFPSQKAMNQAVTVEFGVYQFGTKLLTLYDEITANVTLTLPLSCNRSAEIN